jgi:hypothetical protein
MMMTSDADDLRIILNQLYEYNDHDTKWQKINDCLTDQYTFEIIESESNFVLKINHIDLLVPKYHFEVTVFKPKWSRYVGSIHVRAIGNGTDQIIHAPHIQWCLYQGGVGGGGIRFNVASLIRYLTHVDVLHYYTYR